MKKWSDRELNAVEWVISYISPGSLEMKYRKDIAVIKEKPFVQHKYYSEAEKKAIEAAIIYFEDFYRYSIKDAADKSSDLLCAVLLSAAFVGGEVIILPEASAPTGRGGLCHRPEWSFHPRADGIRWE